MEPLYKSCSDVAADVLRQMMDVRRVDRARPKTFYEKAAGSLRRAFRGDAEDEHQLARMSAGSSQLSLSQPVEDATIRPLWSFWPICRFEQSVFAETFRLALIEGLGVVDAAEIAGEVNPCWTLRHALKLFCSDLRAGYSLGASMRRSRGWVDRGLLAALEIGQEYDCLTVELLAFVRQDRWFTSARYRKAIGRRTETANFAAALARLLREHSLTGSLVLAAGRLSGSRGVRFLHTLKDVVEDMEDRGRRLPEALRRHPRYFDVVFCRFLESKESREEIRECLERLAVAGKVS
jgi:type II secretory pathway component PulF